MSFARIAFATMVRNEPFFLPRWIRYYSSIVPKENLFILLDGADQTLPPEAEGCQIVTLERWENASGWDDKRWKIISDFANELLTRFEVVCFNDVDEFLAQDPASGQDLKTVLSTAREGIVLSPFALEVVHRRDLEPAPINHTQPILGQRRFARINSNYAKPCITGAELRWSLGGHKSTFPTLTLPEGLYLFHMRYLDRDMLMARQSERLRLIAEGGDNAAGAGWQHSLERIEEFMDSFEVHEPRPEEDFHFEWQTKRITREWNCNPKTGFWTHGRLFNVKSYTIPERFHGIF